MELHYHGKENKAQGYLHQHGGDQSLPQALYEDPRVLLVAGVQGGIRGGLEICLLVEMVDLDMWLIPEQKEAKVSCVIQGYERADQSN